MIIYEGKKPYNDELESTAYNGMSYSPITLVLCIVALPVVLICFCFRFMSKQLSVMILSFCNMIEEALDKKIVPINDKCKI